MARKKVVVGVTGASGAPYALKFLEILKQTRCDVSLIVSDSAKYILDDELEGGYKALAKLVGEVLDVKDMAAWPASG